MKQRIGKNLEKFGSVESQFSKESSHNDQFRDYEKRIQEHSYEEEGNSEQYENGQALIDFQNLDIEPIQNTTGDKFIIDQTQQQSSYSQSESQQSKQIHFLQSSIWPDVFYAKKSIMHLLQQRNQVCQFYHLNSKSLKLINTTQANKRIFTDLDIAHYAKQLFQQSPSYQQLDPISFTVIPQMSSLAQKYFVFMGCDDRFVPQCKSCNLSAYLILNVQNKQKYHLTHSNFSDKSNFADKSTFADKLTKSASIKGKILCSNSKCKKKLLGQFAISQQQKTPKSGSFTRQNTFASNGTEKIKNLRNQTQQCEKKRPELSQKHKILIKKAAMKVNL